MEDFNHVLAEAHVKLMPHQGIGNGVVMPFNIDVIVDIDLGTFPLGVLIRCGRKRAQG
jgi:hypothetical protein